MSKRFAPSRAIGNGDRGTHSREMHNREMHNRETHHHTDRKSHHPEHVKQNLINRLNRIEGQVRGVKGMIEKDTYCDDVLNQIASIQSALNGVGKLLLENHMKSCVAERIQEGDFEVIPELLRTMNKLMR